MADYTTIHGPDAAQPRRRAGWEFMAALRNVFDADVRAPSLAPGLSLPNDLPMPGRTWSLQAQCQFRCQRGSHAARAGVVACGYLQ
jgi:hypothetical protein